MPQIKALLGGAKNKLPGGLNLFWEPGVIDVEFPNGRRQKVDYQLRDDQYTFSSRVATAGSLYNISWGELAREILMRNRSTSVVAFGFGKRDCVEAWIWQRASTLQAEELRFYVGQLAREADRFEYLLTGKDIY